MTVTTAAESSESASSPAGLAELAGRRFSPVPGRGLSVALTWLYLGALVAIPIGALVYVVSRTSFDKIIASVSTPRTLAAYGLSFGASAVATVIAVPIGLMLAWTIARYDFPFRRLIDALVDLPFALPTAVSGIALTALWSPRGWFGRFLAPHGIEVAFSRTGIVIALVFVAVPFVVRSVQPVLEDLPREIEEAAHSLGATPAQTFLRVIFPAIRPALVSGATLGFARAIGEYGSVVFIAGNAPFRTEIAPHLVYMRLEEHDYAAAASIAAGMLALSLVLLLVFHRAARNIARGRT